MPFNSIIIQVIYLDPIMLKDFISDLSFSDETTWGEDVLNAFNLDIY